MERRTKYENSYIKTDKGVYIGRIENKKKNGWGIAINNNGNKYEGLFQNDEKHLFGSELLCCLYSHNYKYKKYKKECEEENSEKEFEKGNICLHENRYIYIGNFKKGEKYGNGILIDYNTYAMYNCIFLKNEIIYKDVLFSVVNNISLKHKNWNSEYNYHDKKNDENKHENNFSDFNKKKKKENDIFLFIENRYKYSIFNYNNFFKHTVKKIKKEDFIESFCYSKYRNNVYHGDINKKKKKKKVPLNNMKEKKKKKENNSDGILNSISYKDIEMSGENIVEILKEKNKGENSYYEKGDNDYFMNEPFKKYIDDISIRKHPEPEEKEEMVEQLSNEKKYTDNLFTYQKNNNIIKENSKNYDKNLHNNKHINNFYENFQKISKDGTFDNSLFTEMSKNLSTSKLKNPSNDIKVYDSKNKKKIYINKGGQKEKGKKELLREETISKKLNSGEKNIMKEVEYKIKENELKNKNFSIENIEASTVLSNIEREDEFSDHSFLKKEKNMRYVKIDNLYQSHDKMASIQNRMNYVDVNNAAVINKKSNIFNKENFKDMHNIVDNDTTSSSSSNSTSTDDTISVDNEMKNNVTEINNSHSKNTSNNSRSNGSFSSSSGISSCDSISDIEKNSINNIKGKEKNYSNYSNHININSTTTNNIRSNDNNSLFKINNNKRRKEKGRENGIYNKFIISKNNASLNLKREESMYKEIQYLLPQFLRKEKKRICLSRAQNCIYWDVFELNFFLFFIGIPKKILEIFIINQIDGYCLKYLEKKLLKKMGIHDKIIRKYILLAVQYLLRLREKYKYKKKSKKLNAKIDSNFTLKKKKIHLLNLIGRGGYSNVYRCFYGDNIISNNDYLYIKYLINNMALKIFIDKKYTSEFFSELQILSMLRHPNVSLFLGGLQNPRGIALEYIRCGSIFDILHKHKVKIKIYDIIKMCKDITAFMCFLHYKGILHCDLKSSNILLSLSGEIKICDFGLSVQNPYQKPKFLGIVGTYQWTAPEVLRGEGYTQQADIYSFGVILWEFLHRKIPFNDLKHPLDIIANVGYGNKELVINKSIPQKIRYILKRCLHRNRYKRKSFFFWSEYFDLLHKTQAIDIEENLNLFFG